MMHKATVVKIRCLFQLVFLQLRPTSPTELGADDEVDDEATEAPTVFDCNQTVVDQEGQEKCWYSRLNEVEEEYEMVPEELLEAKRESLDEKEMATTPVAPSSRKRMAPSTGKVAPSSSKPGAYTQRLPVQKKSPTCRPCDLGSVKKT